MSNEYFNPSGNPGTGSQGLSALMRTEFSNISAAFVLMPVLGGNGSKAVVINAGGTAMTVTTGTLALAGNFATTGAFNTTLVQGASVSLTLPLVNGTLALLASPTFTGTPAGPTAAPGTNTTQFATTAYVQAAVSGVVSGVSSVNTRTGAVTLVLSDIPGAAPLASPTFTGVPAAPTAAAGTNTTQLATTAFVTASFAAPGPIGGTTPSTGAFTTLSASSTVSGAGFTAWAASPPPIGSTAANTGAFTTLSATSTVSGAGFTARFASPGPIGNTSASTGAFTTLAASGAVSGAGFATMLQGYIGGLTLTRSSATVLGVSAGTCVDSTAAAIIGLGTFTKSTAGTWVSGSGSNGMGTALTIANSTWYHVFAIINAGAADVYFDTSVTAANKPASTTAFRRLGSFLTDGSAQIVAFSQNGDEFLLAASAQDVNTSTLGTTATLVTLTSVPSGIKVEALFRFETSTSSVPNRVLLNSPDENSVAGGSLAGTNLSSVVAQIVSQAMSGHMRIRTNTSQQIRAVAGGASTVLIINTYGWVDTRGRFS